MRTLFVIAFVASACASTVVPADTSSVDAHDAQVVPRDDRTDTRADVVGSDIQDVQDTQDIHDVQPDIAMAEPCGDMTCGPNQLCIRPACCSSCAYPDDAGNCPPGSSYGGGTCGPHGMGGPCVFPCHTTQSIHCATIPADCTRVPRCQCLDVNRECGDYGGMCLGNDPPLGLVICFACY